MPDINSLDLPKFLYSFPTDYELYVEYGVQYQLVKKILYRTYLRTILSERQNHRCCYCYRTVNDTHNSSIQCTLEHIIPESRGGATDLWNCVIACAKCNRTRGNTYTCIEDEVVLGRDNDDQCVYPYGEALDARGRPR